MNVISSDYFNDFLDDFVVNKVDSLKCDIYEEHDKFIIKVDLPGYDKNNIYIQCKDGYLIINASRENNLDISDKNYLKKERLYGKFTRTFNLGYINEELIEAKYNNGVLNLVVPKIDKQNNMKIIKILD